jgi:4-aminobutyrate aminotransferase-like enzyme
MHFATLACGSCSVRFRPALIFSKENVDYVADAIAKAVKTI